MTIEQAPCLSDGESPTPCPITQVQVARYEHDGRLRALVRIADAGGKSQDLEMTEQAAWTTLVGLTHFLRMAHRHERLEVDGERRVGERREP